MTPKINARKNEVTWTIGLGTYPMDAVYGAAYVFLDRCYVYLDKPNAKQIKVVLSGKTPMDADALGALAGEFSNELLHQVLRTRIAKRTGKVREMIIGRALFSAEAPADDFAFPEDDFDDDADYLDDPLGIAVPWEEKYGSEAPVDQAPDPDGAPPVDPSSSPGGQS